MESREPRLEMPDEDAEKETENELSEARKTFFQALKELKENINNEESEMEPPEGQDIPSEPTGKLQDSGNADRDDKLSQTLMGSKSEKAGEDDETVIPGRRNLETADNIKIIMKALEGDFQRNIAKKSFHPGGSPRKWKTMTSFDELEDIDPFEAFLWAQDTAPALPHVQLREKEVAGGEIAILRDVSTSMMGVYSEWSSSVVKGVIELARSKRMKIGYIEFNHRSFKYKKNARFFTKDYNWINELASRTDCSGNTNYEDALKDALLEFKGRGLRNKHILFITDGIPTSGDCDVFSERQTAKKIGVCIHSIFIGSKNYPKILEKVSQETVGKQFVASKGKDGVIRIQRKDKAFSGPKEARRDFDPFAKVFSSY
ncbi:MAG: vWA domain-containing protein [Thermodesulfobacteriota bacterium]